MARRPVHVCFVAPFAFPVLDRASGINWIGGAEVQQVMIATGLAERGYRVSMICIDFGQPDVVCLHGVTVYRTYRRNAGIPFLRFLAPRLTSMVAAMHRANADVYYQRSAGMLTGVMAAYCRASGRKSIFAASGDPNFEKRTVRIRNRRDQWIYEWGLRNVDQVLAQNRYQYERCIENFHREPIIVPSYCNVPAIAGRMARAEILWVSTIREIKRPALFLELAASMPEYRFRMIGGPTAGNQALFDAIRARAMELPNVEFMGFQRLEETERHFDTAAVFVNTSESEGFPNAFLQAWVRETPTVSFVDCGARIDGVPVGRVVLDLVDLERNVRALMADESTRSIEGAICRRYVEANHAPDRILAQYEDILAAMIDR